LGRSSGLDNDPRLVIIPFRLAGVKKIIAVMSSKGGVGKTVIASLTSLVLSDRGYRVGLLDLDFTNPSTHIVLGIDPSKHTPVEEKGIIPPIIYGVKYFSIVMYSGDNPLPLRGEAVDDVFREILAITRWGDLDYLIIDTPPGIGDEHLDLLTYIGDRVEALLVSTPSPLAVKSIERLARILIDGGYRIMGLVENMSNNQYLRETCSKLNIHYLGSIPYVENLDSYFGNLEKLKKTKLWSRLSDILSV